MDSRKLKQEQKIPQVSWNGLFSKGVPISGGPLTPVPNLTPIDLTSFLAPSGGQPGVKGGPSQVPELFNLTRKI